MGSHACAVFFCWWLLPKMSRSFQGGDPRILVCGICICTPRRSQTVSCGWIHTHTRDRATQEDLQTLLCLTGLYKIMLKRGCHLESESGSVPELCAGEDAKAARKYRVRRFTMMISRDDQKRRQRASIRDIPGSHGYFWKSFLNRQISLNCLWDLPDLFSSLFCIWFPWKILGFVILPSSY